MSASSPVASLGPERRVPVAGAPGAYMRIADDLRKSVVFFGEEDARPGRGGIRCIGTGFLLYYGGAGYLVTSKHLAYDLGEFPFLLRVNKRDGTAENIPFDELGWFHHPDPTVDVSIGQI